MNGDTRKENFNCQAVSSNNDLLVGKIKEDKESKTFIIPITSSKNMGIATLKVMVYNGTSYKEKSIQFIIDNPNAENVLRGVSANLKQYLNGFVYNSPVKEYTTKDLTDGDTKKEACNMVENPCRNQRDFWAIFNNNKGWNLSKIKIHIPNNNQGENDNEEKGIVNKTIEIRISEDGRGWKTIHTFENIGKTSLLECMLPQYQTVKQLAIVCTLNPLFYPSLSEVEAYEQNKDAVATCVPVTIKEGFNADVIVEALPADKHITKAVDAGGWTFYTKGVERAEGGHLVGSDGRIVAKSGNAYQLAPFDTYNALVIDEAYKTKQITFEQPEQAKHIYVLYTSTGGANNNIGITPIYEDDTKGEEYWINGLDWYGYNDDLTALGDLGRVMAVDNEYSTEGEVNDFDFRNEFRVFEYDYEVNTNKKVKALLFRSFSFNQWTTILAVSKFGLPSKPTAIHSPIRQQASYVKGIYNLNGIKLNTPQKGINIIRYGNGITKKIFLNTGAK